MGTAAGGLNALLITRLRLPPLIVTLGTFSLFRGLGEGFTRGFENYSQFPDSFLFLGQGYLAGRRANAVADLYCRGDRLSGFCCSAPRLAADCMRLASRPEGARHAGIPVERRLALVYILSGLTASLAAIIYVAHLGQAKSDAGTGYELDAITAVVLGGTSIFGGRGTIQGTVLGLLAITVLKNGLAAGRLARVFGRHLDGRAVARHDKHGAAEHSRSPLRNDSSTRRAKSLK